MCNGIRELQETLLRAGDPAEMVATRIRERVLQLHHTNSSTQQFVLGYGYVDDSKEQGFLHE